VKREQKGAQGDAKKLKRGLMVKNRKRLFMVGCLMEAALVLLAGLVPSSGLYAQTASEGRERSVEESYLDEPINLVVVRQYTQAVDRGSKMAALDYLADYIDRGNTGTDVSVMLEGLALEGILNKTNEGGRTTNNFPDVRAKAVQLLGDCGTAEAQASIVKVMGIEREPDVQYEALNALIKTGVADNPGVVEKARQVFEDFNARNPDNRMAWALLDLYGALINTEQGLKNVPSLNTIYNISENPIYTKPVRDQAKAILIKARGGK
jgi:hypothetical protein